jgi:hypothetical protein
LGYHTENSLLTTQKLNMVDCAKIVNFKNQSVFPMGMKRVHTQVSITRYNLKAITVDNGCYGYIRASRKQGNNKVLGLHQVNNLVVPFRQTIDELQVDTAGAFLYGSERTVSKNWRNFASAGILLSVYEDPVPDAECFNTRHRRYHRNKKYLLPLADSSVSRSLSSSARPGINTILEEVIVIAENLLDKAVEKPVGNLQPHLNSFGQFPNKFVAAAWDAGSFLTVENGKVYYSEDRIVVEVGSYKTIEEKVQKKF